VGKGKQPTTKRIKTQVVKQRDPRPRSHKVRYSFSDEEGGLSDTDDEIQGYLCVSADPRRSGIRVSRGGRKLHSHHGGTKVIVSLQVKHPRPSAGETYGPMSPPGDISLHSSATTGTVNATPSPLNNRN
jgi:hypothetical protein